MVSGNRDVQLIIQELGKVSCDVHGRAFIRGSEALRRVLSKLSHYLLRYYLFRFYARKVARARRRFPRHARAVGA